MHRPDAGTCQHGHQCFGHHRHIDNDAVALGHTSGHQYACQSRNTIQQLIIGKVGFAIRNRAVVNDGGLVPTAGRNMPVNCVVTGVAFGVGEPLIKRSVGVIESLSRRCAPIHCFGGLCPIGGRIGFPFSIYAFVGIHRSLLLRRNLFFC